jgi:hypothetical protein
MKALANKRNIAVFFFSAMKKKYTLQIAGMDAAINPIQVSFS